MTFPILLEIFLLGIGLSADAFSVALTDGLLVELICDIIKLHIS